MIWNSTRKNAILQQFKTKGRTFSGNILPLKMARWTKKNKRTSFSYQQLITWWFPMKIPIYQIDTFTEQVFKGNPAAVCPLEDWLPDDVLQSIAAENNLSETAFFIPATDGYHIRWFTPTVEVELCGHATLASAHVLFELLDDESVDIIFHSMSGELSVTQKSGLLEMNFPGYQLSECTTPVELIRAFGTEPVQVFKSDDYLAVYESEQDIRDLSPDFELLKQLDCRGIIVTAQGSTTDFVSRFFAPRYGINEDPVTGSAHCVLVPYWASVLDKTRFTAAQLSKRGGFLKCELIGDRVLIGGKAVTYLEGFITLVS